MDGEDMGIQDKGNPYATERVNMSTSAEAEVKWKKTENRVWKGTSGLYHWRLGCYIKEYVLALTK